jgi:hypothetical protein
VSVAPCGRTLVVRFSYSQYSLPQRSSLVGSFRALYARLKTLSFDFCRQSAFGGCRGIILRLLKATVDHPISTSVVTLQGCNNIQQHTVPSPYSVVQSPYLFPYLLFPTTNTGIMAPIKRVKKVMTLPINVIFSHLQVRFWW